MVHMLYRIRKIIVSTAVIANMVGTSVLFVIVAVMNGDVVARGIFNSPIRGVVEIVVFSLVLIVFLQLPDVVNNGRLTRSDGLLSVLKEKNPQLSRILSRLIDAIAGVFMLMIAWTIWPEFIESFESCRFFEPYSPEGLTSHLSLAFSRCEYFGTPGIFTAPWWPARLAIFFGVTLSAIIFIFNSLLGIDEPKSKQGSKN
jgi:TRAP-type C4-dicarboxylate transport system permease small subunit